LHGLLEDRTETVIAGIVYEEDEENGEDDLRVEKEKKEEAESVGNPVFKAFEKAKGVDDLYRIAGEVDPYYLHAFQGVCPPICRGLGQPRPLRQMTKPTLSSSGDLAARTPPGSSIVERSATRKSFTRVQHALTEKKASSQQELFVPSFIYIQRSGNE